jgi:hypothetical protein
MGTRPEPVHVVEKSSCVEPRTKSCRDTPFPRERFFVGTRKTDDGDAGGIAEEV